MCAQRKRAPKLVRPRHSQFTSVHRSYRCGECSPPGPEMDVYISCVVFVPTDSPPMPLPSATIARCMASRVSNQCSPGPLGGSSAKDCCTMCFKLRGRGHSPRWSCLNRPTCGMIVSLRISLALLCAHRPTPRAEGSRRRRAVPSQIMRLAPRSPQRLGVGALLTPIRHRSSNTARRRTVGVRAPLAPARHRGSKTARPKPCGLEHSSPRNRRIS